MTKANFSVSWRQEEELQESDLDLPDHYILMDCGGLGRILCDAFEEGRACFPRLPECAILIGV